MSVIVLGADPSITACGFGIVDRTTREVLHLETVRSSADEPDFDRYRAITTRAIALCIRFRVQLFAIENQAHVHIGARERKQSNANNSKTLIAYGALIAAAFSLGLPVIGKSPQRVKKAVLGRGADNADKKQVKRAVTRMLGGEEEAGVFSTDAADAVAVACAPSLVEIAAALR